MYSGEYMGQKKVWVWLVIIVYLAVFLLIYSQDPLPKIPKMTIYLLPVVWLTGASGYLYRRVRGGALRKAALYLLLGSVACLIAEFLWVGFDFVLGEAPYPSIADVFYLLAYPLLTVGILSQVKMEQLRLNSGRFMFSSMLVLLLMGVTFYFGILQAYDIEADLLTNVVSIVYGIADMIVLISALLALNVAEENRASKKGWSLLALGMAVTWLGDLLYSFYYQPFNENVFPYILIDLSWASWYILMGAAFVYLAIGQGEREAPAEGSG